MYGEKRIQVDGPVGADGNPMKLEYRVWNPFRSKLAAAILGKQEESTTKLAQFIHSSLIRQSYESISSPFILTLIFILIIIFFYV